MSGEGAPSSGGDCADVEPCMALPPAGSASYCLRIALSSRMGGEVEEEEKGRKERGGGRIQKEERISPSPLLQPWPMAALLRRELPLPAVSVQTMMCS